MKMHTVFVLAAGLVLGLGMGCSDDDDGEPQTFSAVTFNGGLARGFVPYADERASEVANAVGALDVDLVCVQEFWEPADVDLLASAASANLPNQLFLEPLPDENPGEVSCSPDATEVQEMETCARAACDTDPPPADLVACVLGACGPEYAALPPECISCIAANIGATIDETFSACNTSSSAYAYGGSFGIGILTSAAITTSDSSRFASTFNRRAVLYAELETEALGTVHVFCTHLTAIFSAIPWPKPTGSWEEEQLYQITEMRDYIDEMAGPDGTVILLGDFNTGPAGATWVAEHVENYNTLAAGYTVPYPDSPGADCTFCDTNVLNGGVDHDSSEVIDHILYRNFDGTTEAMRVLDGLSSISTDEGTPLPYSDHFGVQVTFTR